MNTQAHLLTRFLLAPQASYDASHTNRIQQSLNLRDPLKQAAVLIPLVPRQNHYHVVFTRRAQHLKHHPGQVSFPGGKYESHDRDLIATALRETHEETGIVCSRENIIGQLPALPTVSGYLVTPFLSIISPDYTPTLDANEVDELFEVPLDYLLNPVNMRAQEVTIRGKKHHIYSVPFHQYSIWGATAQMIKVLSKQLWHEPK
ncbi:CoA pyrophosphatase [Photobacterium aphoticum]|nr:CoA pyrophosphatase [Photobacterium aphoticum]PSU57627.1 CoA pyrophosphatase [Photobacterium aphoticum]GHA37718.1 coenzyme A pyrophosphatase [Photobacterium aphoticum]